jgi:hypothetical protein
VSPTAHVYAVKHGTVTEDKGEQETNIASRPPPTKKKSNIGSSNKINNKEEVFSGCLQDYDSNSTNNDKS